MGQIKDMQTGADGDNFAVGGTLSVTGNATLSSTLTVNSSVGTAGQALLSRGAGLSPEWGAAFVSGMIMMWSGSIASIPSGWLLCNGSNGTPDLRNRFVVGAGSTYAVGATGGSADAIVVSHTHTINDPGHSHTYTATLNEFASGRISLNDRYPVQTNNTGTSTTGITVNNTGSSGTNANLPPYYALCYIMKS
jgi:microcystin-dependent protein